MEKQTIFELIVDLEEEMRRMKYSEATINLYCAKWERIRRFFEERNEMYFTMELGIQFLEKIDYFKHFENGTLSDYFINMSRTINMIGVFQEHRTILQRYSNGDSVVLNDAHSDIKEKYLTYLNENDYSKNTKHYRIKHSDRFMLYLESQKKTANYFTFEDCFNYIRTIKGYQHDSVRLFMDSLRAFLRFLNDKNIYPQEFVDLIPTIKGHKQPKLPSVWSEEELNKLLSAIDRGSPIGKRDYALILLIAKLGLRTIDVKKLKFENIDWDQKTISIIQSKTKQPLSLPLLDDVGWAIIEYLKKGRPKTDSSYIFLSHSVPFQPLSEQNHLYNIIDKYRKRAGILKNGKKRGMHALRHTLGTMLLNNDIPLPIISSVLGHVNTEQADTYARANVEKLIECALNWETEESGDNDE